MCGWLSDEAVCASCAKRRRACASATDVRQELDRHAAVQPEIRGAIHKPHAAAAEDRFDAVVAEGRARVELGGLGCACRCAHVGDAVLRQQLFDRLPELGISGRARGHERGTFGRRTLQRGLIQGSDQLLLRGRHLARSRWRLRHDSKKYAGGKTSGRAQRRISPIGERKSMLPRS